MPALSFWFHLTPQDFDEMTAGEADEYLEQLKKIDRDLSK